MDSPIPTELMPLVLEWHFVGSRVTCDPAPFDTDNDVLVRTEDAAGFADAAGEIGFDTSGSWAEREVYETGFVSVRKGELNIIATQDDSFFTKFMLATAQARQRNILDKDDRIALFQEVLYGVPRNAVQHENQEAHAH